MHDGPIALTADEVDRLWGPLIGQLHAPLRAALRGAGIDRKQLAEVVLVGGATRMPCVQRAVAEILGCQPVHRGDPDLVVAEGAAIQAAMIEGATAVQEMVVTDVASHSLGVEVAREVGSQRLGGYFTPVIHRNTVIPTTQGETFSTIGDDQRGVTLKIYEGDGRRVADNRKIGELDVTGIPRGRAPKHVVVRFTCDQNGMLEFQAEIQETKAQVSAVFRREGGEVTGAELEGARARGTAARRGVRLRRAR